MPTPDPAQSTQCPDEIVRQSAGGESPRNPRVEIKDQGDLAGAAMPPVNRYLDETGGTPTRSFGDWQGTWIEDA